MSAFTVRLGTIDEALAVEGLIPEFGDLTARERYEQQLRGAPALILVAEAEWLVSAGHHIVEVRGHGEDARIRFSLPLTAGCGRSS